MNNLPNPLMNEQQAAQKLGLRVATLQRWRWSGKGPRFLKIEGAVRYDPADLNFFIETSRRQSTSDNGNNSSSPIGRAK